MIRTLVVFVAGLAVGVAGMFVATTTRAPEPILTQRASEAGAPVSAPTFQSAVPPPSGRDAASLYRQVTEAASDDLPALIGRVATEPKSTQRDFALGTLLLRYAEVDARRAVERATAVGVHGALLAPVYVRWAAADSGAALGALAKLDNAGDAAAVGAALIDALGGDAQALERVARAVRGGAAASAARPGLISPAAAGLGFDPTSPMLQLAATWVGDDPKRALAVVADVRDPGIHDGFEAIALREWGRAEPSAMLDYLATLAPDAQRNVMLAGGLGAVAAADPLGMLDRAASFAPDIRDSIQMAALQALVAQDPSAALAYVDRLPGGFPRQQFLQMVAMSYGQRDPGGALAWAESQPERAKLVPSVISAMAVSDPDRAWDLALGLAAPADRMQALQRLLMSGMRRAGDFEALAGKVMSLDDTTLRDNASMMLVQMWSSRSPEAALDWVLANDLKLRPGVFEQLGQQLGRSDPRFAVGATQMGRVPAEARGPWIRGVAQGYAQNDPRAAMQWLEQFRGEAVYGDSVMAVVQAAMQQDPLEAARIFEAAGDRLGGRQGVQLAANIAMSWANQDPAAAAAWALDRVDAQGVSPALGGVISVWSGRDVEAARAWALRLPRGAQRDGALPPLLADRSSTAGLLDQRVLNAFSSEEARRTAIMQAINGVAFADPDRARRIADYYVTDPAQRAQVEGVIERAREGPRAAPTFNFRQ